jgi:hypothetical protein
LRGAVLAHQRHRQAPGGGDEEELPGATGRCFASTPGRRPPLSWPAPSRSRQVSWPTICGGCAITAWSGPPAVAARRPTSSPSRVCASCFRWSTSSEPQPGTHVRPRSRPGPVTTTSPDASE